MVQDKFKHVSEWKKKNRKRNGKEKLKEKDRIEKKRIEKDVGKRDTK